jgi:plastocyanin
MRRILSLLLGTGVLALGVAACGGSGGSSASATSSGAGGAAAAPTPTSPAAATGGGGATSKLSISAPKSGALMFNTKTLVAKAGTVTVTFTNDSPEGHNFTVAQGANGSVVGATPTFTGGTKTLTLHLKAGKYTFYCSVPGHRQAGMQGTLTVS